MSEVFGGRLAGWARALAGRYRRIGAQRRRPALVLALARPTLQVRCQRWQAAAWTLSPTIRLSVGPLLAAVPGPDRRRPAPRPPLASPPPVAGPPLSARPAAQVEEGWWRPEPAGPPWPARTWPSPAAPAPVALVRAVARPHRLAAAAGRRQTRLDVRRQGVVERVVRRWERVEIRRPGPPALLHRPAAQPPEDGWRPAPPAAAGGWPVAPPGPGARPRATSWLRPGATFPNQAAPQVDLQRLTDQVSEELDRRIGAHRERMGRSR